MIAFLVCGVAEGDDPIDFLTWAESHEVVGQNVDDDKDGVSNFEEYAFGLDPSAPNSVSPYLDLSELGGGEFKYTRRNQNQFPVGVSYSYEYSTSLNGVWFPISEELGEVREDAKEQGEVEVIKVTMPESLSGARKLFVRVVVAPATPGPIREGPSEFWLKIGQSNAVGFGGAGIDFEGLDAPDPRLFEVSRGANKVGFHDAPASGEIMLYRSPAQDSRARVGFGQNFGKTRLGLNLEIEKLVILNLASGSTGFSNNFWNPGDVLYELAVSRANEVLESYPELIFKGILWHQGETDASAGRTQDEYEADLAAMVEGLRAEIYGGERAIFVCGTMKDEYVAQIETKRRAVDLATRNVPNFIPNSAVVECADLDNMPDIVHFTTPAQRIMGERFAQTVEEIDMPMQNSKHLFRVACGEAWDIYGGAVAPELAISYDETRGTVLDTLGTGSSTDATLNSRAYTKALWVKLNSPGTVFSHLISGQGDPTTRHVFARGGFGHEGGLVAPASLSNTISASNGWNHVALTWDGTEFNLYLNGQPDPGNPFFYPGLSAPPSFSAIELGSLDRNPSAAARALMDEVTILPYALSDTGILKKYNREFLD